jgi:hypothetical protein
MPGELPSEGNNEAIGGDEDIIIVTEPPNYTRLSKKIVQR